MTTTLALANPVATAVNPKPTKKEVIEAMVRLKIEENEEKRKKAQEEAAKIAEELEATFKKLVLKTPNKFRTGAYLGYSYTQDVKGCQLSFNFDDQLPDPVAKKVKRYHELNNLRFPDEKRIRMMIKEGVELNGTTDDRIQALLDSPAAKKALQGMLKTLNV